MYHPVKSRTNLMLESVWSAVHDTAACVNPNNLVLSGCHDKRHRCKCDECHCHIAVVSSNDRTCHFSRFMDFSKIWSVLACQLGKRGHIKGVLQKMSSILYKQVHEIIYSLKMPISLWVHWWSKGINDDAKRVTSMEFIHWIPWNNLNFPRQEGIPCL